MELYSHGPLERFRSIGFILPVKLLTPDDKNYLGFLINMKILNVDQLSRDYHVSARTLYDWAQNWKLNGGKYTPGKIGAPRLLDDVGIAKVKTYLNMKKRKRSTATEESFIDAVKSQMKETKERANKSTFKTDPSERFVFYLKKNIN